MRRFLIFTALFIIVQAGVGRAEVAAIPYRIGDPFETIAGKDQFGKEVAAGPGTSRVLVTFSRDTGTALNDYLVKKGPKSLENPRAVVVADMHSMPGFVKGFVYRSLRKLPHRLLLNESETALVRIPKKAEQITVITLSSEQHVLAVDFIDPEKDLETLFGHTP